MSFRKALRLLLALVAARGFAYTYYYSDAFPTINTANWYYNGSLTTTANGLWSSTYGSLISKLASPTGADHEVKMTLALGSSGGYYIAFLRATPDALAAGNAYGNYYAVQLLSPTYANGSCSGTLQAYKFVSGAVTIFSTTTIPCHNGMTIRAAVFGSTILVYYDNIFVMWITDSSLAYGSPGVEVFYPPAGNGISRADLGPHDYVAPNAIPRASIGVSATPNRVDMQWQGVTDDPNGTGILWYQVVRQDVGGMVWENSTVFSDSTVAPSTTYTYYVQAVDYHWNIASTTVTVVTPQPARPTPAKWGCGRRAHIGEALVKILTCAPAISTSPFRCSKSMGAAGPFLLTSPTIPKTGVRTGAATGTWAATLASGTAGSSKAELSCPFTAVGSRSTIICS